MSEAWQAGAQGVRDKERKREGMECSAYIA